MLTTFKFSKLRQLISISPTYAVHAVATRTSSHGCRQVLVFYLPFSLFPPFKSYLMIHFTVKKLLTASSREFRNLLGAYGFRSASV